MRSGGLCTSHGAKRQKCHVTGCDKYPIRQGKCSAHGGKQKRCEKEVPERGTKAEPTSQESPQVEAKSVKSEEKGEKVEEESTTKVECENSN